MLKREPSVFFDMFSVPQSDEEKPDGFDDTHPLVLSGDTAEEFGALCWATYAL